MTDLAYICWQNWKKRSELVVGKKSIDNNNAIFRIKKAVNEYYHCKKEVNKENGGNGEALIKEKRVVPVEGWMK